VIRKKKILFVCPYPINKAPSQRLKFEQYYNIFKENGYEIKHISFINEDFWNIVYQKGKILKKIFFTILGYIKRLFWVFRLKDYDIVYIHLWVTPFGPSLFERIYRFLSKKIVFDIDDLVFLKHSSKANRYFMKFKGTSKVIYLLKKADYVITCTEYLDSFAKKFNSQTKNIPSSVNTNVYTIKENYELKEPVHIGWSGSHSTSKYLLILEPVFIKLLEMKLNFIVIVFGDKNFLFNNKNIPLNTIEWSEEKEVETIKSFDIGVYPLPYEEWVYGKSGLKAIQYMACGVPTIATAVGSNLKIIKHHFNGFLVENNSIDQWASTILFLINNKKIRENIGKNARVFIEKNYSVNKIKQMYLEVLDKVCS